MQVNTSKPGFSIIFKQSQPLKPETGKAGAPRPEPGVTDKQPLDKKSQPKDKIDSKKGLNYLA